MTVASAQLVQHAIDAISLGSLYALYALGVAVLFGIMQLINFAHGELVMVTAYALVLLSDPPWQVAVPGAIAVTVVVALAMERAAFRPVRGASPATLLVTSFAVSYLLQNLALLLFGATPKGVNLSSDLLQSFSVYGIVVSKLNVVVVATAALLLVSLALFLGRTPLGMQMRAAAEDFQMARLVGVRANTVIAAAFVISGVLGGVASLLLVQRVGLVSPSIGTQTVLVAFVAVVLGGMGSLVGAALGGFALGVLTISLDAFLPLELRYYRDAFAYSAVIAILLVRPQGLIVPRGLRTRV